MGGSCRGDYLLCACGRKWCLGVEGQAIVLPDIQTPYDAITHHPTRTDRCGQPVAPSGSGGLYSSGATLPSPSVARISMFAAAPLASNGKTQRTQVKSGLIDGSKVASAQVAPSSRLISTRKMPRFPAAATPAATAAPAEICSPCAGVSMRPQIWYGAGSLQPRVCQYPW